MEMVALPENTGFCGAVNLGFEMTTTPYAILLNNDTEAEPHFVEELLKGIRQSERIFSCGAQMLDFKQRELWKTDRCFFLLWRSGHLPDVRVKTDRCDG